VVNHVVKHRENRWDNPSGQPTGELSGRLTGEPSGQPSIIWYLRDADGSESPIGYAVVDLLPLNVTKSDFKSLAEFIGGILAVRGLARLQGQTWTAHLGQRPLSPSGETA
jgi:hypothetical protein